MTTMTTHRTDVCVCGAVQYDCDCPGPKPTVVVQHVCKACVGTPAEAPLVPGAEFGRNYPATDEPCMSEEDAASNRAVRLAVFEVLGDLTERETLNPQAFLAEVHERIEVPERWEQLARDLITEALGEELMRRNGPRRRR